MRTILIGLFFTLFFILSVPLFFVEFVVGLFGIRVRTKIAQCIAFVASKIVLWLGGIQVTALGMDNVPQNEAVLYVFNHRSYFDIVIIYATVPGPAGFIAMKSMKGVPFINVWMMFLQCLFLDRNNNRQGLQIVNAGVELLKEGHSLCIAPEGRLSPTGDITMLPFKEGSFKLARKSGCAIIPVAINNADKIFERQFPRVRKTDVVIEYGKPIFINELDVTKKRAGAYIQTAIKEMLEKNQVR